MAELRNLEKLQRLFNLMDDDALTKEQFKRAFNEVVKLIKKNDADYKAKVVQLAQMVKKVEAELKDGNESNFKKALGTVTKQMQKLADQQAQDRSAILQKLAEVRDGDDADEERVIAMTTANVSGKIAKTIVNINIKGKIISLSPQSWSNLKPSSNPIFIYPPKIPF